MTALTKINDQPPERRSTSDTSDFKHSTPTWIRFGVPAAFAVMAGFANYAAIQTQMEPVRAYTLTRNLPVGTRLEESHLKLVRLAGDFDRSGVILEKELRIREDDNARPLSLSVSLARRPRILRHNSRAGEILVRSSLGGLESPRPQERAVEVERSRLQASDEFLSPGQFIYFLVHDKIQEGDLHESQAIGPFRVAWEDPTAKDKDDESSRGKFVRIIYRLHANGEPTSMARLFLRAIGNPTKYSLTGSLHGSTTKQITVSDKYSRVNGRTVANGSAETISLASTSYP